MFTPYPILPQFHGKWALVTGASSGIGAELALHLAAHGANLILTARRKDRLEALAAKLVCYGVEVRVLQADLQDPATPQSIYDQTEGAGLNVDILINNAGLGVYGEFTKSDPVQELAQIRVNCEAMVALTRLFAPQMVARRQGWILILASTASFQPVPYLSTYAATKAFDRFFSLGLAEELAPFNVKVTALCPGPTESEFFEVAGASAFRGRGVQSAEEVVERGLIALARGQRTIIPYFAGQVTAFAVRFLPVVLITYLVAKAAHPGKQRK